MQNRYDLGYLQGHVRDPHVHVHVTIHHTNTFLSLNLTLILLLEDTPPVLGTTHCVDHAAPDGPIRDFGLLQVIYDLVPHRC